MKELLEIRKNFQNTKQIGEEIYQTLRSAIINDVLHSGTRLVEDDLAELFDVSRTPVREAIKRLELEDFITYNPKNGFLVSTFTSDDCFEIVEALEYLRQITTLVAAEHISPINVMRLMRNIETTRAAYQEGTQDLVPLLEEFHAIVAQSINNATLLQAYDALALKYKFVMNRYAAVEIDPKSIEDHQAISEALAAHDKDLAWRLEVAHSATALVNKAKRFLV